ncbi:MAG: hypothetical protein RLZZ457_1125, partial [Pseudomonadota bacterium]
QLADMAFTDPPYNVDYGNNAKDKMRGKDRRIMNDALGDGFYQFLYDACLNLLVVTKGACYVCMSSSELHTLQKAWIDAGGKWSTFIIWAKNTFTLGRADYQRQYEPILYGWKQGTDHFWCGDRDQSDIWNYNKPRVNDLHPTMKPVDWSSVRFKTHPRVVTSCSISLVALAQPSSLAKKPTVRLDWLS